MRILKIQSRSRFPDIEVSQEADGSDLAILASNFNHTDCSDTSPCEGDINGDGAVNAEDLTLFVAEFGRTDCPHDELYYFRNDHLGTPQRITNQTGTIVWSANYKPFGEAIITTNTITNPFRFPGQYYDQETGLHYNYFRYYQPGIGRYLRPDPIGLTIEINLFAYVLNNPIALVDPFGYSSSGDMYRGIGNAITEGTKGALCSIRHATKDMKELAKHGDPLAKTALGIAMASEIASSAGAVIISSPVVITTVLEAGIYSQAIYDAAYGFFIPAPPPANPWGYVGYGTREIFEIIWTKLSIWINAERLENHCYQ